MFGLFSQDATQISAQEVEQQLKATPQPLVLDVREPSEYQLGHIPGSRLLPLGTLGQQLHELPKDRQIIAVCRSGARSGVATSLMRKAGLQALNMSGGMNAWRGPVER